MKLFQYWDSAKPPADVAAWVDHFRANNCELDHALIDERQAVRFLERHHGARAVAAFKACAVPAMQADYIRLCLLITHGGIYVDPDNQSREPLASLIDQVPHAMMLSWLDILNNAFLLFRQPNDPFLSACLALATDNIEHRRFDIEFTSTGPGVVNAVWAVVEPSARPGIIAAFEKPPFTNWGFAELLAHADSLIPRTADLVGAFRAIRVEHTFFSRRWVGHAQPDYKRSDRHWPNWRGSIYR